MILLAGEGMPDLDDSIVQDLKMRAEHFLGTVGGYEKLEFLSAGGSAAVFKVFRNSKLSALKAFNPELFSGSRGDAERRRLAVQKRLIGHGCESLVETYNVTETEGTAFIEMEFVEWPQLTKCLATIPDEAIVPLISQLVSAVQFLDSLKIVHRDIKPDNIHVSQDFQYLKLLDLGVVREFDSPDINDACVTDYGNKRPFLATAQYSSPEYLFRLDEPTDKLWRGLNIYQVGAVLHDLIKKEPLFKYEVSLENRWLVARAVLTKRPSFADQISDRLLALKSLASRCLVKDLDTRLALVGWEDFQLEGSPDPVKALRAKLAKGTVTTLINAAESSDLRIEFDRKEFMKRLSDQIRGELIHICGTQLPLNMISPLPNESTEFKYEFTVNKQVAICCHLRYDWQDGLYNNRANISVGAQIVFSDIDTAMPDVLYRIVSVAVIQEAENEAVARIISQLSQLIFDALGKIEGADSSTSLHGLNLQNPQKIEFP